MMRILILAMILSVQETHGHVLQLILPYKYTYLCANDVVFIMFAVLFGALMKSVTSALSVSISPCGILMVMGMLVGVWCQYYDGIWNYTYLCLVRPGYLLAGFAPTILFHLAFNVDAHTFRRSWGQIIIATIFGISANSAVIGMLMKLVIGSDWTYAEAVLFGLLATPVYPQLIVGVLKEIGYQAKHAISLLEGESLGLFMIAKTLARTVYKYDKDIDRDTTDMMVTILWSPIIGILFGIIAGKLSFYIIRLRCNTTTTISLWTLGMSYASYFVCQCYLKCSGTAAVIALGIVLGLQRQNFTSEFETFLCKFWELLANICNLVISFMAGVVFTRNMTPFMDMSDYPPIIITYCIASVTRITTFFIMAPILSRIGYGFTMNKLILICWGCIRSQLCTIISFVGIDNQFDNFGVQLTANIIGLYFLSLVFNVSTLPFLMNYLNMGQMSSFKRSNMNNCFKHVLEARVRSISMLKMDRFLSDANWPIVQKYSLIKHPYKSGKAVASEEDQKDMTLFGYYQTTCPDCFKEVVSEPTKRELRDMKKESRLRILKAKKISYMKQYEKGLLSKDGLRVLSASVETATESKDALVDLQGLYKLFNKQGCAYFIRKHILDFFISSSHPDIVPPRKVFRRFCYNIVTKAYFDIVILLIIITNIAPIAVDLYYMPAAGTTLNRVLFFCNHVFFAAYTLEFIMKVAGYSTFYIFRHGFKTYFMSWWNVFDFLILVIALVDLIMDYLDIFYVINRSGNTLATGTRIMKSMRIIRLLRLLKFCKAWYPHIVQYFDLKIDMHLAFTYEIGKGFVKGEEEVLDLLPQIIDNEDIREELRNSIEADKLAITRELGLIQKNRPWIAVTVKTIQAMRSTLNSMMDGIVELKVAGWVDDYEHKQLLDSLNERMHLVSNINTIPSSPPKVIFYEVSWMAGDRKVSDFLYDNVHSKLYDVGDYVCTEGVKSDGILIVVSGLLKLTYCPTPESFDFQAENGCLPVVDYIVSGSQQDRAEEYIISGNTIGELSTLTKRPYDCDIVAETQSQVYILSRDIIEQAFQINQDPLKGLEARLWRSVSIRIALAILMDVPAYQSLPQDQIKMTLESSFVPNLANFKIFTVNDMIEDIILIEGVLIDYNSKECFFGPCYIPRTVQRLILNKSSLMTIVTTTEVKLLIIPTKDVNEYELMAAAEGISSLDTEPTTQSFQKLYNQYYSRRMKLKIDESKVKIDAGSSSEMQVTQFDMTSSLAVQSFAKRNRMNAQQSSTSKSMYSV